MMTTQHRKYVRTESLISTAINFAVNAAFAIALFYSAEAIPLFGRQSILGDTIATVAMLPFITCIIVTPMTQRRIRAGKVAGYNWVAADHPFLRYLPAGTLFRAVLLGVLAAAAIVPLILAVFTGFGVWHLSFTPFFLYKCALGAGLAALVTPVIVLRALAVDAR